MGSERLRPISEGSVFMLPRKASNFNIILPVFITNTGAQGEYPKASEIIGAKELGTDNPVTSE